MSTVTVSIGRNVGNTPMSDSDWQQFRAETRAVVQGGNIIAPYYEGTGIGTDREESYTIVAEFKPNHELAFTRGLYDLCAQFEQDCVAVTIGQTAFVGPRAWRWT